MPSVITTEVWKERAIEAHGSRFDYSNSIYSANYIDIEVRCKEHDRVFMVRPAYHSDGGNGCPVCRHATVSANLKQTYKTDQVIGKDIMAKLPEGSLESFVRVYSRDKEVIALMECSKHGRYLLISSRMNEGLRCSACAFFDGFKFNRTPEEQHEILKGKIFDKHGDRYDYGDAVFHHRLNFIEFTCPEHGHQEVRIKEHLAGSGCTECDKKDKPKTLEEFMANYPRRMPGTLK